MKKIISVILMAIMLVVAVGAAPYFTQQKFDNKKAYAETKKLQWTTIYDMQKSSEKTRLKANGINLYFFQKDSKLYFSKGKKAKPVKIGKAREIQYIATDGKRVYFTDSKNVGPDEYNSTVYVFTLKTGKLKNIKTLKSHLMWGVFEENDALGFYTREQNDSRYNLYKLNPKTNKARSLFKRYTHVSEGYVKGNFGILCVKDVFSAVSKEKTEKTEILNIYDFANEEMNPLLKGKRIGRFRGEEYRNDYFWQINDGEKSHTSLYKFDWDSGEIINLKEYDDVMVLEQQPGDRVLYGLARKLNGKTAKGQVWSDEQDKYVEGDIKLEDVKIFAIDLQTYEEKLIAELKDLEEDKNMLTSVAVCLNDKNQQGDETCKIQYFTGLITSKAFYAIRDSKIYLYKNIKGKEEHNPSFENEFGGEILTGF